jgi:AraC-like DNA-binding protein
LTQATRWRGVLTIGNGWAILEGLAGANTPHAHLAHQLTASLGGPLEIAWPSGTRSVPEGHYAVIPSGLAHAVGPIGARLRSIYLDSAKFDPPGEKHGISIAQSSVTAALNKLDAQGALAALLRRPFLKHALSSEHPLIALLDIAPATATPSWIANALGISASRLRQLSHSTFGAPMSHVLQWRQLQFAARALSESASLAEAAEAGGFADQSHFTRRMHRWFGVAPGAGLSGLDVRVAAAAPEC